MRISIVIPVYNEERNIVDCLETIVAQTIPPDEVIVVDNNCTDRTVALASQYPFVRSVKENKQGRGHARSKGFNEATSEIIGRIDADSRLAPDWVERVKSRFEADDTLMGLTGIGLTSFLPLVRKFRSTIFSRSYYWFVHAQFHTITMWGATMAIRKSAWERVAAKVCLDDNMVHEDQDVSLWIASEGSKIIQDNSVRIATSGHTYRYLPKLLHYHTLFKSTKRLHTENGNLDSSDLPRLRHRETVFGSFLALFPGMLLGFYAVVFFPLDYLMVKLLHKESWLE